MSRDFKNEYLELVNEEIPDLWDRIEAGLREKTVPETEKKNKINPVIFRKRYAGLAAAVLCAAVVIPAFMFTRGMNKSASFESAAEAPAEAAQVTEECAVEEAAEAVCDTAEDVYDEISESGAGGIEETTGQETMENEGAAADVPEAVSEEAALEDLDEGIGADKTESAFRKEETISEAASKRQDKGEALILENVTVQVTAVNNTDAKETDQGEHSMEGVLYQAIVVDDPSGTFSVDEQIEIFVPADSLFDMTTGNTFEIDLICDADGEYPLVVDNISPFLNETGQ